MMGTLDRYIAKQYAFNIVALLVLLFSFVVSVDVALNVDKFLERADQWMASAPAGAAAGEGGVVAAGGSAGGSGSGGGGVAVGAGGAVRRIAITALMVIDLWWPRLLQLFGYLVGLVLVAAMGFTFTQLVRHRELVAVLASGVSLHRVARPILIVAALVLCLKALNQEFILSRPDIAPLLTRGNEDMGSRNWSEFPVQLLRDSKNRIVQAKSFDPVANQMLRVHIWEREQGGRVRRVISADSAIWRNGGWDLDNPRLEPMTLSAGFGGNASGGTGGAGLGGDSAAAPRRIETDLDPAALKLNRFKVFSESLSWTQISEMLRSSQLDPKVRERLQRVRYSRISQFLSAMLSLVVAMPFYLLREPRNMLKQTLKCAPVGIASLMGGVLLSLVEWPGLPPGFAVFIPVLVLIPVAVAMVSWVRT